VVTLDPWRACQSAVRDRSVIFPRPGRSRCRPVLGRRRDHEPLRVGFAVAERTRIMTRALDKTLSRVVMRRDSSPRLDLPNDRGASRGPRYAPARERNASKPGRGTPRLAHGLSLVSQSSTVRSRAASLECRASAASSSSRKRMCSPGCSAVSAWTTFRRSSPWMRGHGLLRGRPGHGDTPGAGCASIL